jgi:CBS domain-containing protein/gamma-glutamyl:cysteine ligase YbdK (ATP-grasp superfamily)
MGEHAIHRAADEAEARAFTRAVVRDIHALEELIARGGIETDVTRVGAEQEMYLIRGDCRPAPLANDVLARLHDTRFTTELARFNLETNFEPQVFAGNFLEQLETDLEDALRTVSAAAGELGAHVLLTGILPTLRVEDLRADNLSPDLRYQYLNEALFRGRDAVTVVIDGIDQYEGTYDSVVLEGVNTSLQLHLQVDPAESADRYNLMQLVTAPLLAAASNSPVLLGRRLWHETRIAVFERSLDERTGSQVARGFPSRVLFGDAWLKGSIVDLFRDNVARFPVILTRGLEEDSPAVVAEGKVPQLAALTLHNGTVWRWNRPCYGATNGVAHLRIENRVLPAGPTVIDEVANAALLYGMMAALPRSYGNVAKRLPFSDAKVNFLSAARLGLAAEFNWLDGRQIDARSLLLEELLPAARQGLESVGVPDAQIERYLGVIDARVRSGQTGSNWLLSTFQAHRGREPSAVWRDAVAAMLEQQKSGRAVHEWELAPRMERLPATEPNVASIMTTDLFTLRPDDVVDLAISVMEWKHIRHIPVESDNGELFGVLTARDLLHVYQAYSDRADPLWDAVRTLMRTDIVKVEPETGLRQALALMLESDLGCLLVVARGRLIGIVTERDLVRAASEVLEGDAT